MKNKIQILLVDDEVDFLDTVSFWLRSKGYSVIHANNGQQALELIKSGHPNIVFLDIKMPVMDGVETLVHIREFNKELPVIMLTAYADEKSLTRTRQLGISGFFPKKADFAHLTNIIETTLRTHKKLRSDQKPKKDKRG